MGAKRAQRRDLRQMGYPVTVAFPLFHPLRGLVVAVYVASSSLVADAVSGSSNTTIIVATLTTITGLGTALITTRLGRSRAEAKTTPVAAPVSPVWSEASVNALVRENLELRAKDETSAVEIASLRAQLAVLLPPPPPPTPAPPAHTTTRRRGSAGRRS